MRVYDNGAFFSVSVSPAEMYEFAQRWPCSGMRNARRGMWFQFDKRNGDLVDIKGEREFYDGAAVLALSQDAQAYGEKQFRCTNCGGPLPANHGTTSKDGKHKFCDACAGIAEALTIGNPKVRELVLYEGNTDGPVPGLRAVTSWTGAVLGYEYGKTSPRRRAFAPVRYRVKMLDGSRWYGYGPSANGNYIRLRRYANE